MNKKRKITDHIVVHCSATSADEDIGRREIDRWHRARGFLGIGYQFVIRRNGDVEKGREIDEVGAHATGFNSRSVGICMVGGLKEGYKKALPTEQWKFAEDNFTEAQKKTLALLVDQMLTIYPGSKVLGHRDLPGVQKACPCFDVIPWWDSQKGFIDHVYGPETQSEQTVHRSGFND